MYKKHIVAVLIALMILNSLSAVASVTKPLMTYDESAETALKTELPTVYAKQYCANRGIQFTSLSDFINNYPDAYNDYVLPKAKEAAKERSARELPGETEHIVNNNDLIESECSEIQIVNDGVLLDNGAYATWGFFLPYDSPSVVISYTGGGSILFETEENTYSLHLESTPEGQAASAELSFSDNLQKLPAQYRSWGDTRGFERKFAEHGGEKKVTISLISDEGSVTINSLTFKKELTMGPNSEVFPAFSDNEKKQSYEMETISTVLMHIDSPIIVVNGGTRYIDNDSVTTEPYNYNGYMYLPVNTLAKALGYYHEVIDEKGYALMRSDTHEVVLMGGHCSVTRGQAETEILTTDAFIYHNGKILTSVRFFAELMGETVGYKNGLVVIDDKYTVNEVLNDEDYFSYANSKFDGFTGATVSGKTYYAAPKDTIKSAGNGTYARPYTLEEVYSKVSAGDTVILKEGTYREVLAPATSGNPNAPITYKAETKGEVILSALEELTSASLTDEEKNIYSFDMNGIDLGDGRNQIFVDGEMKSEARYPDADPSNIHAPGLSDAWGVRGEIYKQGKNEDGTVDYVTMVSDYLFDNDEEDYWKGGTYVGTFGNSYALLSGKIVGSSKGKILIDNSDTNPQRNQTWWWKTWCSSVANGSDQWNYGMIIGHKNAMNLEYEWIVDSGKLNIILPLEADADNLNIEAKARQLVIDLTDKEFINIEGINTIGGGITLGKSRMCMLNNMDMKYISHYTLNSDAKSGYIDFPFDFKNPGAPQRGEVGIYLGGTDDIIVNSRIDHSAGAAIYSTGKYSYIENNIMSNCGYMGSYVSGIHVDTIPWEDISVPRGGLSIYNNTIYNAGRGAIDFNRNENTGPHTDAPILPCDIAYNDFHDACLTAEDAGTVYCNGRNAGFDKNFTKVRNNYIYQTLDSEYANPYDSLLYWDGNAHGFDTFNNILFTTGDVGTQMVSIASVDGAEAYDRLWNNQLIGAIEINEETVADSLNDTYFSEDRPFFAGSYLDRTSDYLNNYNRFASDLYSMQYCAREAILSDGVTINEKDGYAVFTGDNQYIDFKNVDFGSASNEIVISYHCDSNWTFDDLEVLVYTGDNVSNGKTYRVTLPQQDAPGLDNVCTVRFMTDSLSGTKNVRIKVTDFYSIRIGGINVYNRTKLEKNDEFSYFAYPSTYKEYTRYSGEYYSMLGDASIVTGNPNLSGVNQVTSGKYVLYDNQEITDSSDYFIMAAGSRGSYRNQVVRVYLVDKDTEYFTSKEKLRKQEPVAEFRILNQHFYDFTPIKVPLTKEISAGTYDIYLDFVGESGKGPSNILYFGFLKTEAQNSQFSTQVKWQGGLYDKKLCSENAFQSENLERNSKSFKKLINAKSGTTAGYSGIEVLSDCKGLVVSYKVPKPEYEGQNITVRVVNSENTELVYSTEFTTKFRDSSEFNEVTLNLNVPKGNYKVYFDFSGAEEKACQLGWFRFTE